MARGRLQLASISVLIIIPNLIFCLFLSYLEAFVTSFAIVECCDSKFVELGVLFGGLSVLAL